MKKLLSIGLFMLTALVFTAFRPLIGTGYGIGDTAADFKLTNVDGTQHSLAGIQGAKGYIVVFTCNACPYAQAYEDRIIALHKKYAPLGFSVVAINPNDKNVQPGDSFDKMKERAKAKQYPFLYLYDESQEVAKNYGATRTPHVYVLDATRTVRYIGAIDDNSEDPSGVTEKYVENAVDALLAGKEVATKETKAIGCSIKWRKS